MAEVQCLRGKGTLHGSRNLYLYNGAGFERKGCYVRALCEEESTSTEEISSAVQSTQRFFNACEGVAFMMKREKCAAE